MGSLRDIQDVNATKLEMLETGLRGNNIGVARLLMASRFTDKRQKELAQQLRRNTAGMGFTQEQMSNVADSALGLSQQFKVSTVSLMKSIEGMSSE